MNEDFYYNITDNTFELTYEDTIRIVKKIDNEYRYDVELILYAFADKFLDGKDLEKVKCTIIISKRKVNKKNQK